MQTTRPLFQLDPGWLFVLAGLGVCAAGVLLPAQTDLEALQRQVSQLRSEEVQAYARLKAHADFMDQMDQANPGLIRRLAAAQLNIVPQGDTPVLLSNADTAPVTNWIDNTVHVDIRPSSPVPTSKLSRLANGPNRLWMFGAGIMAVFVGLMLSPTPPSLRRDPVDAWDESGYDGDDDHQSVAVLKPLDEESEPAETKALLELLETDEAVDAAATAMMDDLSLHQSGDEAVVLESEPESLDSFELAAGSMVAPVLQAGKASDGDQPQIPTPISANERPLDDVLSGPIEPSAVPVASFGGCLTIATDDAVDEDDIDVIDREVEAYSGIDGDDGYVFEDMDDEADRDAPNSDDDDEEDDDGSTGSFGSNPFRR